MIKSFLKKIWNILMLLRVIAFQLYAMLVVGGSCIVINIFTYLGLPLSWKMAVCVVWTYLYRLGMLVFFAGLYSCYRNYKY